MIASRHGPLLERLEPAGATVPWPELARATGASERAPVEGLAAELREAGFPIQLDAIGARLLAPIERLTEAAIAPRLETRWAGRSYHHLDLTGSTNEDAARAARGGAPHGAVVVAEAQTAGRGRRGRTWFSPPGRSLLLSLLLRPPLAPSRVAPIAIVAGLAVARAVRAETGLDARLKWPNDIEVGGRKVAGILAELGADQDRVDHVVIGIGLNVRGRRDELPADLVDRAATLESEGPARPPERPALLACVLLELERACDRFVADGLDPFVAAFDELDALAGAEVRVVLGADDGALPTAVVDAGAGARGVEGIACGLSADGSLAVRTASGVIGVRAGEVVRVRPR